MKVFIVFVGRKTGDHWYFWKVWEKTQLTENQTIFLEKRSFLEQSHETYIFSYFYDFASFFLQISLLIYCLLWTSRVVCSCYWICLYICMSCFLFHFGPFNLFCKWLMHGFIFDIGVWESCFCSLISPPAPSQWRMHEMRLRILNFLFDSLLFSLLFFTLFLYLSLFILSRESFVEVTRGLRGKNMWGC